MNITRDPKTGKFHASDKISIEHKSHIEEISLDSSGLSPVQALMGIISMVVYYAHENNVHPDLLTPEN